MSGEGGGSPKALPPALILNGKPFYDLWVREHMGGDYQAANWIQDQAADLVADFIDGGSPPIVAMLVGMQLMCMAAAAADLQTDKLVAFMKDQAIPMFDAARYLTQRRENEFEEQVRRGGDVVPAKH